MPHCLEGKRQYGGSKPGYLQAPAEFAFKPRLWKNPTSRTR